MSDKARDLSCCCCGEYAGHWCQWYNRDNGFGVCFECVTYIHKRFPAEDITRNYGVEGVNWGRTA